jgi:uncharacterized protein (DUF2147 family)
MKRIACLMVLMALSSPASARDSYFTFRGHRIHLQAVRHCRSLSCIALSIPGIHRRRGRDWDADDVANTADPAQTPVPAPAQAQPAPAPAQIQPPPAPVQAQPSPAPAQPRPAPLIAQAAPAPVTRAPAAPIPVAAAPAPAPVQTRPVPAPTLAVVAPIVQVAPPAGKSAVQVTNSTPPPAPPSVGFDVADKPAQRPAVAAQPAPQAAPQVARASEESDDATIDTPIGDWQTEGKGGLVRIEPCGEALCGYVLNASTRSKGETVLVNMKAQNITQWTGNVYSRSSGNGYYGTMTLKETNTLRVEACAVGKFFCSGNNWTRIDEGRSTGPNGMATSRRNVAGARS